MKRQHVLWYALTLAAVVVATFALGTPASALLLLVAAMACPLMMMFMMGGRHGGGPQSGTGDPGSHKVAS
jgi:hypothetical protein